MCRAAAEYRERTVSVEPTEFAINPVHLQPLSADLFAGDGLRVVSPGELLRQHGLDDLGALVSTIGPVHGGVQDAPAGAIQDPAGSAIGSGQRPAGGGASGAIYRAFTDLRPIPNIEPRSAIFNSATGAGRRILHTHSPRLAGSPGQNEDRRRVIEDLANAYANALAAFADRAGELGADGTTLNLVPVSAGIFSGRFSDPTLDHLHPSYTMCAIALALGWCRGAGVFAPALTIYFFEPDVFTAAATVLAELS
jgi:hypothetical protein